MCNREHTEGVMRKKTIQYGIDPDTGYVWSRVDSEVAVPVIDFAAMGPSDGFAMKANLERMSTLDALPSINWVRWTRKVPIELKNMHREFWGMKPLKVAA